MLRGLFLFVCAALALTSAAPRSPEGRVVGGVDAKTGEFPYQVSVREQNIHICGGTVLTNNIILTAAHCIKYPEDGEMITTPVEWMSVRAGSVDRFRGGVLLNVVEYILHEEYEDLWNDVGLLRLEAPLIYSSQIRPIPIASKATPAGSDIVISGWGLLWANGDMPRTMQWNTLTAITKEACNEAIGVFKDNILCLGHPADNGACHGDSGGPAVYNGEIVGIAGFVKHGCASPHPDGYANVFYHRDWILKNAKLLGMQ